jgi:hypothetical protein
MCYCESHNTDNTTMSNFVFFRSLLSFSVRDAYITGRYVLSTVTITKPRPYEELSAKRKFAYCHRRELELATMRVRVSHRGKPFLLYAVQNTSAVVAYQFTQRLGQFTDVR